MKKISSLLVACMVALCASAYTLNNPIGADGRYIVKYDCASGQFAASNDMEVDETFVFAIDITGTWLEDFVKAPATAEGASRGIAFNNWTNYGDTNQDFRRLKQINGNIYGMTCNFKQVMVDPSKAIMKDSIVYVYGQIFVFEFTSDNPGAGWWMWDVNEVNSTQADGADCLFAFAPYTGNKTSEDLYSDDYEDGNMFNQNVTGYAAPCILSTGVEDVVSADIKPVAVEYYNVLGARLSEVPVEGVFIRTSIYDNGKRVSEKIVLSK